MTAKEKEKVKGITKAVSTTKEAAKEKLKALPSTGSKIGAHGVSTTTKELHYAQVRKDDGGLPPLRTKECLDGLPSLTPHQLLQVQEEIHRRSSILCIAVFQQGGFAAQEQPINSLAWCESFHQQFLEQCSCYYVATPAFKWGLDWYKTWVIAATSDKIQSLAGQCNRNNHQDFRGKRTPDVSFISALTAEYPSKLATAIIDIIRPWVSQSSSFNQDLIQWKNLLAKKPIVRGPHMAQVTTVQQTGQFPCLKTSSKTSENDGSRVSSTTTFTQSLCKHSTQSNPARSSLMMNFYPSYWTYNLVSHPAQWTLLDFQPFRLKLFHTLLTLARDPDADIALHLEEGIPSGAFSPLFPVGLWEANSSANMPRQLEQCKPRPINYKVSHSTRAGRRLHRRASQHPRS